MAMTREDILKAAEETLYLARKHEIDVVDSHSTEIDKTIPAASYAHLADMYERMQNPELGEARLNRWLGWIQAAVYIRGFGAISLDEMKDVNMRNSDNARKGEEDQAVS